MATNNTSFLPPPLHSCFFTKQIFIRGVRVSLPVCVFELQYSFNQTLVSKWIYVLIRDTPFDYLLVSQREAYKKYDYAMLWIIWTEVTFKCFFFFFSLSTILLVFSVLSYFASLLPSLPFFPFKTWKPQWSNFLSQAGTGTWDITDRNRLTLSMFLDLVLDWKQYGYICWMQNVSW